MTKLKAAVLAALEHDPDPRVDTASLEMVAAPDGKTFVVFYDFWEFHMGATSAKVALVNHDAKILRVFPFDNTSTGAGHLATFSGDSAMVCIGEPGAVTCWSFSDERFAVCRLGFTPSSLTLTPAMLRVREHAYRWGKQGGYYEDGPKGADFRLADLEWHDSAELSRYRELLAATKSAAAQALDQEP